MSKNMVVHGSKGGQQKPHTPTEMEDNLISINKIKVLLAVSDGETEGSISASDIYLNDVPVVGANGTVNYPDVKFDYRPGTQTQSYIKGMEDSASEVTVQRVITASNPFIIPVTNRSLSAIRLKMFMPRGVFSEDNGDMVGVKVEYAVDMAIDGGSYQLVFKDTISGKTMNGYDRSRRVNLPGFNSQVLVRVRRITADSTNAKLIDEIRVQSYAEVIDAKFRYPLTGMLYVEFNSDSFPQMPSIAVKKKWKLISVPSNYDPETRTYSGSWNGVFKKAWSNNPAWVLYDIISNQRYGLDQRELGVPVDKWSLYDAAQYCDQMVPDGKGGTEPRYLCDMVVQSQVEAYNLVRDICSIFRGMSFWNGESLSIVIDRPRSSSYLFTNDNVVNGSFQYTFASEKSMYTQCNVTFDDEQNMYQQDVEGVFDQEGAIRFGYNMTSITAIGCTRRSEANRRGRWVLKTNLRSTTITFATGLEGMIPMVGDVISIQDNFWATNLNLTLSGRLMEVQSLQVFTAFRVDARPGDYIIVNKPDGVPVRRTIASVSPDGKTITLNVGFGFQVEPDAVFAIDRTDVTLQQYVVTSISKGDGDDEFMYNISALEYDPNKYDEIDYGVNIDDRPTSIVDPDNMQPPTDINVSSYSRIVQGISVETMVINWKKAQYASMYEVQWRKNDGNWINIPRTPNIEVEVEGIYAGTYYVRVRSISSGQNTSPWSPVVVTGLTGKVGDPKTPVSLTASDDEVFGIRVKWGMPPGSEDTAYIELHQSKDGTDANASLVTLIPYPQFEYWHSILPAGYVNFYKARAVDRIGNVSPWTPFARGMASDDVDKIAEVVKIDIESTEGFKDLAENAVDTANKIKDTAQALLQTTIANDADTKVLKKERGARKAQFKQTISLIADETQARVTQITELKAQIDDEVLAQITQMNEAIATETEARVNQVNALATRVGKNESNITQVNQAVVDEASARATADTALDTKIGNTQSAVAQKLDSWISNGQVGASYTLKFGIKQGNTEYSAGMNMQLVSANGVTKAQTLFDVDRFAVGRISGGTIATLPFFIENNQVFMQSAVIKDGSITNAMIGNVIQSNNWGTANAGWRIEKGGAAVFNQVTVRGNIIATAGQFSLTGSGGVSINGNGVTVNLSGGGKIVLGEW